MYITHLESMIWATEELNVAAGLYGAACLVRDAERLLQEPQDLQQVQRVIKRLLEVDLVREAMRDTSRVSDVQVPKGRNDKPARDSIRRSVTRENEALWAELFKEDADPESGELDEVEMIQA